MSRPPRIIYLVTSEKGGQGKSVVCKSLVDYADQLQHPIQIFDCDATNPDVYDTYPNRAKVAYFSEAEEYEDYANGIYEAAQDSDVIVNCPAAVFRSLQSWFEKNSIFALAEEEEIAFAIIFVSDGEPESLNMLQLTLDYFDAKVQHIVLLNEGVLRVRDPAQRWDTFETNTALQENLDAVRANVVCFPKMLGNVQMNQIKDDNLSFLAASQDKERFKSIPRRRIRDFVKAAFAVFAALNLFTPQK